MHEGACDLAVVLKCGVGERWVGLILSRGSQLEVIVGHELECPPVDASGSIQKGHRVATQVGHVLHSTRTQHLKECQLDAVDLVGEL